MNYSEIYAFRIKDLCRQHNITINKLATLSGVRQSTIDNIIKGNSRNPTMITLHKIALAFSMTLSEFLDFAELNDYSFEDCDDT